MRRLASLIGLLFCPLVGAAGPARPELPPLVGHTYTAQAFTPTRLPYIGDIDRLISEFKLAEDELAMVRREDFGNDGEPEWLVVSPNRLCSSAGCSHVLFDGKTAREIGRFFGTLLILDRRQNGYPVVQSIAGQDANFSSLRTYIFGGAQYQLEDEVLIGEGARQRLLTTVRSLD